MVQQLYSEIEKIKAEIRRLRGQMQSIQIGGAILPTSVSPSIATSDFIKWLNGTGSTIPVGSVVKEIATGQDFSKSSLDSVAVIGVLTETTLNGAYGFVRHIGFQATVLVRGTVTAGNYLSSDGSSAGYAYDTGVAAGNPVSPGYFAIALTSFAASSSGSLGTVSAYIFPVVLENSGAQDDAFIIAMAGNL